MKVLWFIMVVAVLTSEGIHVSLKEQKNTMHFTLVNIHCSSWLTSICVVCVQLAAAAKPSGHSDNPEAVKYYGYQVSTQQL
jgi:hypothetical protein